MFKDDTIRKQAIDLACQGNIGATRQVIDDIYERLEALEGPAPDGRPDLSDIHERLGALEAGTAPPADVPQTGDEVTLDERIKIAIRALPEDQYGANGKPHVQAIENALGEPITAADRDRVWRAMQEDE